MQTLENLKIELAEISERLQSVEASISRISKSNETAQKSNNDFKNEPLDESEVPTNTTTNLASESAKRFKLKHVFKNVNKFKENINNDGEWEENFNVKWRLSVLRLNNHFALGVECEPIAQADKWSIRIKTELKLVGKDQINFSKLGFGCYETKRGCKGLSDFIEWEKLEKEFLVKGNVTAEVHMAIIETSGLGKEKIRKFDESQKDVSDVILAVRDTKFHYLASQSSFFKALLLGNFSESQQSEVKLTGIDPDDFHYFLEVLHGESAIDETTVEGVALLADMYDAPTAMRRCEEFLMKESKQSLKKKLKIAARYNLEKLEEKCMSEIEAMEEKRLVVPKDTKVLKKKNWFTFRRPF
ncbi:hypothetical protein B9Z55_007720 [Caenorhabditis nigoni]|uniref:BTB domain-containing protein n=1 Tax=Caenorhabditis nigoni TaxID=1611254 RepID=A0A2G5VBL1_9PELO|nr:hypothetical protein B9Z55_007720 [Caenorhabditis nigoni]